MDNTIYIQIEEELSGKFFNKKMNNIPLIRSYERLGMTKHAERVTSCATDTVFQASEGQPPKLIQVNFCHDRLCNLCSWRRSLKTFGQISQIMDIIEEKYAFLFLTLTVRNCAGEELSTTIDRLIKNFNLFTKYAPIRKICRCYFRALEITTHPEYIRSLEFHPHIHVIMAVNKSYFTSRDYINHDKFIDLWQKACKLDYRPSVRIEKIVPEKCNRKNKEVNLKGAVCEASKYVVKTQEITAGSYSQIDRTVSSISAAITRRRLYEFGGIFKETARKLRLDDLTDGDLVNTDNEKLRPDVGSMIIHFKWQIGFGYVHHFTKKQEPEDTQHDPGTTGNGVPAELCGKKASTGYRARVRRQLE